MTTNWLVSKAATASDSNGGTSQAIRSSGADGIVNATSGVTKITSLTALGTWSAADIGHGICSAGIFRLITAYTANGSVAAVTTASSTTLLSANFTAAMVGQGISGTDIAANTVITAVVVGVSATISIAATGAGSGRTLTLSPMFTTSGNVSMGAGTGSAWVVGGMWKTWASGWASANSPCVGGDTVYLGSGHYREVPTINVSPASMLNVVGDVDGAQTGQPPGEVKVGGYVATDMIGVNAGGINLNSKSFFAFSKITIVACGSTNVISGTAHDVSYTDCVLCTGATGALFSRTVPVDTAVNITLDRCYILQWSGGITITLPTSAAADYDAAVVIRNCLWLTLTGTACLTVTATGANSFKGGGVHVRNCSLLGSYGVSIGSANVSSTYPVTVSGCLIVGATALSAQAVGQIIEDYNVLIASTPRANTTQGLHSQGAATLPTLIHMGQERIWGGLPRPFGALPADSLFAGWGNAAASGIDTVPAVDLLNLLRPGGSVRLVTTGTFTAGAATTATDSGAHFGAGSLLQGATVKITGGTGSGQVKVIASHTDTVLTVFGNWSTTPDNTSTYAIYFGAPAEQFTCTSGSTTTAVQSSASWVVNQWAGYTFLVVSGTGNGQTGTVTSNTGTTLTVPALGTGLDNTSVIRLYRKTDENTINTAVGALERHTTWRPETVTTNDNTTPLSTIGAGQHDFLVPVHSGHLTTISAYLRYDGTYAGSPLPQLQIDANATIGVTAETKTMVAAANTWEKLTLTAFTPTADGLVRVRVLAASTAVLGKSFADTFAVSQT